MAESRKFRAFRFAADALVLGPFMIWYAQQSKSMPKLARAALGVAGVLTILFHTILFFDPET